MQHYFVKRINDNLYFANEDIHHIIHVMRCKNNDHIIGIVENEGHFLASLIINNNEVHAKIIEHIVKESELKLDVNLVMSLIKGDKFELVLQKAVELGVSEIYPFKAKRSIIKIDSKEEDKKLLRWNKIAKEALEQSERTNFPKVNKPISIKELINIDADIKLLAFEREGSGTKLLYDILNTALENKKIIIIIGPEGGFEESEVEILIKAGYSSISLGKRILRAETAAISLLSNIAFMCERGI